MPNSRANLLLNTGPQPDGSIPPEHERVLRELGRRIRAEGWPAPVASDAPAAPRKAKKGKATAPTR